ncbi:MAG: hypothetical protein AAFV07_11260 [Bacteroidota bacterium]
MKFFLNMFVATAVLMLSIAFTPGTQASIVGIWEAPDLENSTIQVYQATDGFFYGKIIESDREDWIGEIILKETAYDPANQAWRGEIYSLRRFFTVDAVLTLESTNKLKLVGTKFFMSKTFYWNRRS